MKQAFVVAPNELHWFKRRHQIESPVLVSVAQKSRASLHFQAASPAQCHLRELLSDFLQPSCYLSVHQLPETMVAEKNGRYLMPN